jgi:hypothetical protein
MRHLFVDAPRIGAWLRDFWVEDAGARKQYATTDDPSKLHELREQELNLLAELIAISAEYSETRDFNGALAEFYPADVITGRR